MLNDIDKAKFELLTFKNSAFIANVLLNLNIKEDNSIPTANVDGITIKIPSDFWNSLTIEEKMFVLAHEAWHVAYEHTCMDTTGLDVPTLFKAADYTINNMLVQAGYTMPVWGLLNLNWKDLSTKEIYDLLLQNKDPQAPTDTFSQAPSKTEMQEIKTTIQKILVQSAIVAAQSNQAGSIPSDVARNIAKLVKPVLPWFTILHKFLKVMDKSDYSYQKPNRRYLPKYLPSLRSNNSLSDIAIATDASGSVSDGDYTVFFSEIHKILHSLKPKKVTLLPFTTKIEEEIILKKSSDIFKIKSKGYGGTDIEPVLEWTIKHRPKLLIVFSDMDFYFPDGMKPSCPIIWIHKSEYDRRSDIHVPYGKLIYYEKT